MIAHECIEQMVDESFATKTPLERIFNRTVFGGKPPTMWGDWPQWARDAWDTAARMWVYRYRGYTNSSRQRAPNTSIVSIAQAWKAVCESSRQRDPMVRLSWQDIARRLGISPKSASYQFGKLGFAFGGVFGSATNPRELVAGPCVMCGKPTLMDDLDPFYVACSPCYAASKEETPILTGDLGPYEWAKPLAQHGHAEVGSDVG